GRRREIGPATRPPQFFGGFPSSRLGGARLGRLNAAVLGRKGTAMKARTLVIDLLAIVFVTLCYGIAAAVEARAEEPELLAPLPSDPGQGTLLLRGKDSAAPCAAPLLHTDVDIKVSGIVARARVTQTFRNPFDEWFEGVYVFPLPENAAVDRLKMRI